MADLFQHATSIDDDPNGAGSPAGRPEWTSDMAHALQSQGVLQVDHGIVLVNETEGVVQVNPSAARFLGMPSGACALSEFNARFDALRQSAANADSLAVEMSRLLSSPDSRISKWLWHFAGPSMHLHLSVAPVLTETIRGRVWVFQDVSELFDALKMVRSLEHRLNQLLSEGDVIAFRLRQGGVFEWVSRSTTRMLGFDDSTYLGRKASEFCHPDDIPLFVKMVKHLRATGEPQQIGIRIHDVTGRMRSLEGRVFLAHDDRESLEVIMSDVTSHVELQDLRAQVASVASHEIKTPLAFMTTGLEMLEDGSIDISTSQGREVVDRMQAAAARLARMSDDLLGLHRLEITRTPVANETIPVFAVVRRAAMTVVTERGVRVDIHDKSGVATCRVDGDLLEQAVINLVSNAIRHSPNDGVVDVTVVVEAGVVTIVVRDRGPGVPLESRQEIFQPFVRLNGDRRGAGLGLAIVDRIARLHQGSVTVDDPDDPNDAAGSSFTLTLADIGERR